jgi:hypothetical protein
MPPGPGGLDGRFGCRDYALRRELRCALDHKASGDDDVTMPSLFWKEAA